MNIPNPAQAVKKRRKMRRIEKARDKYRYDLAVFEDKHSAQKDISDRLLVFGVLMYFGSIILSGILGIPWLFELGMFAFLGAAIAPIAYEVWEKYELAKYTSLTLHIIPREGEDKHPIPVLIHGAWFGSPLENDEEVIAFIEAQGYVLNHAITSSDNGEAKRAIERAQQVAQDSKIYPVYIKDAREPAFLVSFHDKPDAILSPKREEVSLTTGSGQLRHAEFYVLEAEPIKTSRKIEDEIVDIEIPLFLPFVTQTAIEHWLEVTEWFVPSPIVKEVIRYTKQLQDFEENASTFQTLREERDDITDAYMNLLKDRKVEGDRDEFERGFAGVSDIKSRGDRAQDVIRDAVIFLFGFMVCYILFVVGI